MGYISATSCARGKSKGRNRPAAVFYKLYAMLTLAPMRAIEKWGPLGLGHFLVRLGMLTHSAAVEHPRGTEAPP